MGKSIFAVAVAVAVFGAACAAPLPAGEPNRFDETSAGAAAADSESEPTDDAEDDSVDAGSDDPGAVAASDPSGAAAGSVSSSSDSAGPTSTSGTGRPRPRDLPPVRDYDEEERPEICGALVAGVITVDTFVGSAPPNVFVACTPRMPAFCAPVASKNRVVAPGKDVAGAIAALETDCEFTCQCADAP